MLFFNSALQLIFSILRNTSYTSPFDSSTEGALLKCLWKIARNACNSKDVDALKFRHVHHGTFTIAKLNKIAPNVSWC